MRKSGIYKITNPKGKVYIGQSVDLERRLQQYRGVCVTISGQPNIWESLNQYGSETHQYKIIEYCSLKNLDSREAYYKQQFIDKNGWDKALFCWINDPPTSEEKRARFKIKQHEIDKRIGIKTFYDIVYQYDLGGNFIREWDNDKLRSLELKFRAPINLCARGGGTLAFGYQWKYKQCDKIEPYNKRGYRGAGVSKYKHLFD